MTSSKIPVAIVDDHPVFRTGVVSLLSEFPEIEIIFEAADGMEMQQKLKKNQMPSVILMDIKMSGMDGIAATAWLKENHPDIKVLALSMFEEDDIIFKMIKTGARGYVLKESRSSEIVAAIKAIAATGYYINEKVSGKLIHSVQKGNTGVNLGIVMSENEMEFIRLCCTELTYKEMASKMNLSPHTIENYRESVFQKLNVKSRIGIVLYAFKNDLVNISNS
jgi:DNA-binding NarL/FixJ family response regulator